MSLEQIFLGGASAERRCGGESPDCPRARALSLSAVRQQEAFTSTLFQRWGSQTRDTHMLTIFNQNLEKHLGKQIKDLSAHLKVHIFKPRNGWVGINFSKARTYLSQFNAYVSILMCYYN